MGEVETKLVDLLLDGNHFLLLLGIVALIWSLTLCRPVSEFLFVTPDGKKSRWQWLVMPINLALSLVGVFLLGLSPLTEVGPRLMVALLISALATASWEWAIKYLDGWIRKRFGQPPAP
jgi:hypothetical protein